MRGTQQAINSVADGAEIRVAQGGYGDNIFINGAKNFAPGGGWKNNFPSEILALTSPDIDGVSAAGAATEASDSYSNGLHTAEPLLREISFGNDSALTLTANCEFQNLDLS